jgi:hypothetical protein
MPASPSRAAPTADREDRDRARGVPVWYILADNEGHGFARKDNADFYFAAAVKFLQDVLEPRRADRRGQRPEAIFA